MNRSRRWLSTRILPRHKRSIDLSNTATYHAPDAVTDADCCPEPPRRIIGGACDSTPFPPSPRSSSASVPVPLPPPPTLPPAAPRANRDGPPLPPAPTPTPTPPALPDPPWPSVVECDSWTLGPCEDPGALESDPAPAALEAKRLTPWPAAPRSHGAGEAEPPPRLGVGGAERPATLPCSVEDCSRARAACGGKGACGTRY